ncbi:MAG: DUF2147 domain-containing protein [Saprospirales bacterium]|nr:DUF2147 domain-containing protein [Saprospirales bacterium]
MQQFIFLSLCMLFCMSTFAQNTNDRILGQWTDEDHTRVLEFVRNGSFYDAIIREAEPSSLIGKKQITSLKYDTGNAYKDGLLHAFQKGKTANCSAKLLEDNKLQLKASKGLTSKSSVWTRVTK